MRVCPWPEWRCWQSYQCICSPWKVYKELTGMWIATLVWGSLRRRQTQRDRSPCLLSRKPTGFSSLRREGTERKLWLGASAVRSCRPLVKRSVGVTVAHVSYCQLERASWTSSTGLAQAPRRLVASIEADLHRGSLCHFWGNHLLRGSWSNL